MELLVHTDSHENLLAKTVSVKTIKEEPLKNCECDSSSVSVGQYFLSASDGELTTDIKPVLSELLESVTNESDDPKVKPHDPSSLRWFSGHDSMQQELKPNNSEIDPLLSENVKLEISTSHSPSLDSHQSLEDVKPDISSYYVTFHDSNTTSCAFNSVKQEIIHTKETNLPEVDIIQPFSSTIDSITFEAKQEPVFGEESQCEDHLNTMETGFPESIELPKRGRRRKVQEIYECGICSKTFSNRCHLLNHLNEHTGVKKFKCEKCNKFFSQNHTLIEHHCKTNTKHNDLKKKKVEIVKPKGKKCNIDKVLHFCDVCGKSYSTKTSINIHKRIHTEEKHFCDVCGKSYPTKTSIDIHKRIHTEEKPYSCAFCDSKFAIHSDLHVHLRTHLGEKRFSCELRGKQYHRKNHLNDHRLQNDSDARPSSCEFCGKTFVVRASLLVHIKTHTREWKLSPTVPL